jgi:fluoroacetyl-CoA thioesterase
MKEDLLVGEEFIHHYPVPQNKTVRHLYAESKEFSTFPEVFATGFMVGLMEWACVRAMSPFMESGEGSVGTAIRVTHTAATPPGLTVQVTVRLLERQGKLLTWNVTAHDGVDEIGAGTHERIVIDVDRFNKGVEKKRLRALATQETHGAGEA